MRNCDPPAFSLLCSSTSSLLCGCHSTVARFPIPHRPATPTRCLMTCANCISRQPLSPLSAKLRVDRVNLLRIKGTSWSRLDRLPQLRQGILWASWETCCTTPTICRILQIVFGPKLSRWLLKFPTTRSCSCRQLFWMDPWKWRHARHWTSTRLAPLALVAALLRAYGSATQLPTRIHPHWHCASISPLRSLTPPALCSESRTRRRCSVPPPTRRSLVPPSTCA
mmetsp:Transcript_57547/g.132703  ORF Transcript_57547/g.132703 Transcript_57547/m.132703 type:complete len:224 (+) Transcript_57547:1186-1857(+)